MARIYYREEKLSGQSLVNKIINLKSFDFILENTNTNKFEIIHNSKTSFFDFIRPKKEIFKNVTISKDDIHYKATEGKFYLPNALIFYDKDDYNFPTEFYFIAKIGEKLEIRKCLAGKDIKWFQIPDLHQEISDTKIILKIENSFAEVKKLVETTCNKQIDISKENKKKEELRKIEENAPFLNEIEKNAYRELIELCINLNSIEKNILDFLSQLKKYDQNSGYPSTLNQVIDFLNENEIIFILRLDWKADFEDLEWLLTTSLKVNFNMSINLPIENYYDKLDSLSLDNLFKDYNETLKKIGLQIGFIDTQSDEYVFFIHKSEDKEKIEIKIKEIGYDYCDI